VSSLRLTEQEAFPSYSWVLTVRLLEIMKMLPISFLKRINAQLHVGILGSMSGHSNLKCFPLNDDDDDDNNNNKPVI
jgi:hypothetical protein